MRDAVYVTNRKVIMMRRMLKNEHKLCSKIAFTVLAPTLFLGNSLEQRPSNKSNLDSSVTEEVRGDYLHGNGPALV
jgi:hypothetical protein